MEKMGWFGKLGEYKYRVHHYKTGLNEVGGFFARRGAKS